MKKLIPVLAFSFLFAVLTQSCKKEKHGVNTTQTITANLEMNKSYQFDLGNIPHSGLKFEQQASHFLISQVEQATTSPNTFYNYTPASNYVGSDQVTIVVSEKGGHCNGHHENGEHQGEHHGNCKGDHHEGSCKHKDHDDDDKNTTTYIINFTVVNPGTVSVIKSTTNN